jgi:hypothetical protein
MIMVNALPLEDAMIVMMKITMTKITIVHLHQEVAMVEVKAADLQAAPAVVGLVIPKAMQELAARIAPITMMIMMTIAVHLHQGVVAAADLQAVPAVVGSAILKAMQELVATVMITIIIMILIMKITMMIAVHLHLGAAAVEVAAADLQAAPAPAVVGLAILKDMQELAAIVMIMIIMIVVHLRLEVVAEVATDNFLMPLDKNY